MKIFTVAEMVAAEKRANEAVTSYPQMMEAAGRGVAEAIMARRPVAGKQLLVLVGAGNNGGDGLVAGRYLAEAGANVTFYLFKGRDPAGDENFARIQHHFTLLADFDQRYRVLRLRLRTADIVLDALLGTGVTRPIRGNLAALLRQVRAGLEERRQEMTAPFLTNVADWQRPAGPPQPLVVAVDCPSGLNCDSGDLDPLAIPAGLTVTFGGPKRGHFRFPGAAACGELVVADIGLAPYSKEVSLELATVEKIASWLPTRPADGHKGTFGKVLIVGGSANYWGAPILSGRAAYRAGAGVVALAVPGRIRPVAVGQLPEATYPTLDDPDDLSEATATALLSDINRYQAVLLGPGLGPAIGFVGRFLAARPLPPLIIDADGLNVLAGMGEWWRLVPAGTILTPHPAEMARLMGQPLAEVIGQERVALAKTKAAEWGCVLLLKGAYTIIAAPDGRSMLLPFANPVLGIAGSGDVLAGIITALLGQGMESFQAAVVGGYWHGAAGMASGRDTANAGLLASQLADHLPKVRQQWIGSNSF